MFNMSRGAKTTLILVLVFVIILGVGVGSWFLLKDRRAKAAENYIKTGDEFMEQEDYANALICYKKALLFTPRSYTPYYKQGILAKTTGHFDEAISYLNQSLNYGSKEIVVHLAMGEVYSLKGETEKAKNSLLNAYRINPQDDKILYLLAENSLRQEETEEAKDYFKQASEVSGKNEYKIYLALLEAFSDPTNSEGLVAGINSEVQIKEMNLTDFSKVFIKLKGIENLVSRDVLLYQIFNQIGLADFGVKGLERLSVDNAEIRDIWVFLGYGYLKTNKLDEAKKALDKAVELDPVFAFTHYLLGKYYDEVGLFAQAKQEYEKAQDLGFSEKDPLSNEG